jgi:MFS family permease
MTTEAPTQSRDWRYWCAYLIMISPNAALGLTLAAMPAILPQLAEVVGGQERAELVASVASFGMITGGVFSGRLLERFGIRPFVLGSLLLYGLAGMAGMLLEDAVAMGLSRFVLGIAGVCFSTSALALTAATFSGAARSKVIGQQQATAQVVSVFAVFVVSALAQLVGWRAGFVVLGAFALLLFLIALPSVRAMPVRPERAAGAAAAGFWRGFWPICAVTMLCGILTVVPMTQLPFVLAADGFGDSGWVSLVTGFNFVFAAVSAMAFARLKSRFGGARVYLTGLASGTIGIALMGLSHSVGLSCLAASLAGFGTGFYNTYVFDHGVEIVSEEQHGRAAGLLFSFMFLGAAINPLVIDPFEHLFGLHESLVVVAAIALLCGALGVLPRSAGQAEPHSAAP